ncbi:winged helix-turn-helix domain-containing protein [Sphingomonas sp. MMSM20]|uniref:ATP-binding protein n=1 Tax=Sphingomonas lycopersici TaxID=2951807 RepID=UPI002237740C|nr:winged helix-turn-helix domain-containing protein [Sphingomonas lycopersici]MCW6531982.1 winged helix-turn-helix domain-containing protein [Sphingomonas lycopersici]
MSMEKRGGRLAFGPFSLSPDERLLTRDGEPVLIGGRSFDLLVALTEQPGQVLSKRELLKRVWSDVVVEDGSLRFHMAGLRKLLGDGEEGARYIATQVGVGYAFVAPIKWLDMAGEALASPASITDAIEIRVVASATNLPPRLPHLVGREHDVELLSERIAGTRLFTIVGPAGVGKTALAVELGHRLAADFDNRIAFVDFSMLENPAVVPSMIAGAMGIAVQGEDPLAVILGHIRDRPFLLVLDNCEHVIEPTATVIEHIIDAAPDARVLATSREPLRARGEHVHLLGALGYPEDPDALTVAQILAYPAVALFCERAAAADSALVLNEDSVRLIAGICQRLDGMALPIELVAVRAATHGIAATARQLGERFSLGWSGRRTARPRQQTLRATLDWSYDLLSDVERVVFERLAIFVGPFSIDAALDVASDEAIGLDEVAVALDELTAKSLVTAHRASGAGMYRLLEMTRAYAREKLRARGADDYRAITRRHANFYRRELEAIAGQDDEALEDLKLLRLQLGNIRSALDWSFGPDGDAKIGVRLAAASAPVFLNLSHLIECRTWCMRALAAIGAAPDLELELELQGALGLALMFTDGNSASAGDALDRAFDLATRLEDRWNQLRMLARLHIFHKRLGNYAVARAHAERAVEVATRIGDDEALSVAFSLSGISRYLSGDLERARRELELAMEKSGPARRSRTIRYGFDNRSRTGIALAYTLWLSGEAEQASRVARQTVNEATQLQHAVTSCIALVWSLVIHLWMHDLETAEEALDALTRCAEASALDPYIAAANGFRGEIDFQRNRTPGALDAIEQSLAALRAARYELLVTPFTITLAWDLLRTSRFAEARDLVDAAIARCATIGEYFAMPELLRIKAEIIHRLDGDTVAGKGLLRDAIALAREQGAHAWERRATTDLVALSGVAG